MSEIIGRVDWTSKIVSRVTYEIGESYENERHLSSNGACAYGVRANLYPYNVNVGDMILFRPLPKIDRRVILPYDGDPKNLQGQVVRETVYGSYERGGYGMSPSDDARYTLEKLVDGQWIVIFDSKENNEPTS